MTHESWQAFYYSDLQSPWALLVVPFGFLVYRSVAGTDAARAAVPEAARFVSLLTLFFAVETMIDPIATGPLLRLESLSGGLAASAIPFLFVYLGDLRVLLLVIGVARPTAPLSAQLRWALGLALVVPLFAGLGFAAIGLIARDPSQKILWMLYEAGFLALCVWLARSWLRGEAAPGTAGHRYLRAVLAFSATYYALWLAADAVIVLGGLDLGWALRIVPNQLYYAFWAPFVHWRFFSCPSDASGKTAR